MHHSIYSWCYSSSVVGCRGGGVLDAPVTVGLACNERNLKSLDGYHNHPGWGIGSIVNMCVLGTCYHNYKGLILVWSLRHEPVLWGGWTCTVGRMVSALVQLTIHLGVRVWWWPAGVQVCLTRLGRGVILCLPCVCSPNNCHRIPPCETAASAEFLSPPSSHGAPKPPPRFLATHLYLTAQASRSPRFSPSLKLYASKRGKVATVEAE